MVYYFHLIDSEGNAVIAYSYNAILVRWRKVTGTGLRPPKLGLRCNISEQPQQVTAMNKVQR